MPRLASCTWAESIGPFHTGPHRWERTMTIIAPDGPAAPPAASSGVVPAGPERAGAALPEPVVLVRGRLVPGAAITDGVDVEAVVAPIRRAHPDVPAGVVRAAVARAVW